MYQVFNFKEGFFILVLFYNFILGLHRKASLPYRTPLSFRGLGGCLAVTFSLGCSYSCSNPFTCLNRIDMPWKFDRHYFQRTVFVIIM